MNSGGCCAVCTPSWVAYAVGFFWSRGSVLALTPPASTPALSSVMSPPSCSLRRWMLSRCSCCSTSSVARVLESPGSVCVDVGAEFGLYTWTLAGLVGPTGHVHAVEPQPGLARLVDAERALLGAGHVTVHRGALGAAAGVGALSTKDAVELARDFEQLGADAIMIVPPFYDPLDFATLKAFLTAVSDDGRTEKEDCALTERESSAVTGVWK